MDKLKYSRLVMALAALAAIVAASGAGEKWG